jgi:hypothetical protein
MLTFLDRAIALIAEEYHESNRIHPTDFTSYHEAIGIIDEEFTELKQEIFRKEYKQNPARILLEAKQLANVAVKTMIMALKHREHLRQGQRQ